jgi:hypothetical protein
MVFVITAKIRFWNLLKSRPLISIVIKQTKIKEE